MIRIAHESPISIFDKVQSLTDIDYALVNLLDENDRYVDKFSEARQKGREIILDNSIFELGEAFDWAEFASWIEWLKPTWYVVPDVLEDGIKTSVSARDWFFEYGERFKGVSKSIGVVQGKTIEEIESCYYMLDTYANVDMIAISFDYSLYQKLVPHSNKHISRMLGRVALLGQLLERNVINPNKPHHCLGTALPEEGLFYRESNYDWIYSMDSSNPVVHGLKGIEYTDQGLWDKESQKLFELIDLDVTEEQWALINYNMNRFRWFWNGERKE